MSADQGSAPARALRVQHAEAYRLHIIESVYPAHITGMTMALLVTVVSKVRHPGAMLLVDDWPWSDFRGPFAVVAFILLWCTRHTPRAYVEHFESICGLINWLGMLARSCASRAVPDFHWRYMRPVSLFAAATGMRAELRKQWPWTVARLACACLIDAYVFVDADRADGGVNGRFEGARSGESSTLRKIAYADAVVTRFATHNVSELAAHLCFYLGVQAACEAIDAKAFRRRVRAAEAHGRAAGSERFEGGRARMRL